MIVELDGLNLVVLFRLRFGGDSGWGHLARCSALATELRSRGWTCRLWGDPVPEDAPADFRTAFDECIPLETESIATWVVVDDYDCTDESLRVLKTSVGLGGARLLVIDDQCERCLDAADLITNSRLGLRTSSPYTAGVRALLGEKYALLRAGLKTPAVIKTNFPKDYSPILILLGGTDPRAWTAEVLHGLADCAGRKFAPVVLVSKNANGADKVRDALTRFEHSVWLESIDATTFAAWANVCGCAISAAGGSLLELAFMQVPFAALIASENQEALAREARSCWGMPFVEDSNNIRASIPTLIDRLPSVWDFGSQVDGRGVERVADAMEA